MPGLRAALGCLLGTAGLMLAMVSLPAAASAAPDITITYAGPDSSGNPYDLTVTADDGNGLPIQSMTAHVSGTGQPALDVPMSAQSETSTAQQTWAATSLIPESELPAGSYTVTVDASDADESDTALPAPGFSFAYTTSSLTVSAAPPVVTQGSQNVTFSGTLTGTAQGTTSSPIGIAGAPVLLSFNGGTPTQVATTGASGTFSYQPSGATQPGTYDFSVTGTSTYPAADDDVTVTAVASATSMTVSPLSPTVTEGSQQVTFTGSVSVTPPSPPGAQATSIGPGIPVDLSVNGGPATQVATTDASGDYSDTVTGITAGASYVFSVAATSLYTAASATSVVGTQMAPSALTVTASPQYITYGSQSVTFTGTATATPAGSSQPVDLGPGVPVLLSVGGAPATQVATTDSSGRFSYTAGNLTASADYTFSVAATNLYTAASYQVPVDLDPATTSVEVTASPPDVNLASSVVLFAGTVSVTPFGSSDPIGAGSGIPVYLSVAGSTPEQVATTDDSMGDFSYTATGVHQAADYVFSVPAGTLYSAGSDSVPIGTDQVSASLVVTANPASVTEGSQTVTFTGTLTGVSPDATVPVPVAIPDATVDYSSNGAPEGVAGTTNASGKFTFTASGLTAMTEYEFSVASTGAYTAATDDVTVAAVQAPTRFTGIRVTPSRLHYGRPATLTGEAQYRHGRTWAALPHAAVHVTEGSYRVGTVTTNEDGKFTATLPTRHGTFWTATLDAGNLIRQASLTREMAITVPARITSFDAVLQVNNKVSVHGCIETPDKIGYGPQPTIRIQYSRTARHPAWNRFTTLTLRNRGSRPKSCRTAEDSYFSGTAKADLDNAYYRARFAGTSTPGIYSFGTAASKAVHAWKYPTRFVSFSVSRTSVTTGQRFTVTGTLEARAKNGKTWKPWRGQTVSIWATDKGTTYTYRLASTRTNSRGVASVVIAGSPRRYVAILFAVYGGDGTHLACQSKGKDVANNER